MQKTNTREISLNDLFFCALAKWRLLLVFTFCGALLLGVFGTYRAVKNNGSGANQEQDAEAYEKAMKTYDASKNYYEQQLANIETSLAQQDYIRDHSVMLKIDPYNTYRTVLAYYINTGYEIIPELYYQDPNYTAVITNSYLSALRRIRLNELFSAYYNEEVFVGNPVNGNSLSVLVSAPIRRMVR